MPRDLCLQDVLLNMFQRFLPQLVWLSWLGVVPQTERPPVQFPVMVHSWITGLVPSWGAYERQPIAVSLSHRCFSPSLPPSLPPLKKINNFFLKMSAGQKTESSGQEGSIDRWSGEVFILLS